MCNAAQLLAEGVEAPGPGGGEPDIGDQARDHIHLRAELRHGEVMQDVYRAQFQLDRLAHREMQLWTCYQDIVLPVGVVWIHSERVLIADEAGVDGAQD